MIKNIIFDCAGVIKDSIQDHLFVVNKMFEELGVDQITLDELKENWRQPYMDFYNKYVPDLTFENEQILYKKYIMQAPNARSFSGIVEAINEFKEKGIRMVVCSSDLEETLVSEIENFGLDNVFNEVVFDVHDKTESIVRLMDNNNFKKEETVFIGDSNHEIEEGKRAGVKTGAVTWGFCTKEKLLALNPDYIIDNIEELKKIILN